MIFDLWPEFDDWLNEKNILQRGYQGRGWDGNNSNSILSYLDDLEAKIMQASPHLLPFVQCLKDFMTIKDVCFGNDLKDFLNLVIIYRSLKTHSSAVKTLHLPSIRNYQSHGRFILLWLM